MGRSWKKSGVESFRAEPRYHRMLLPWLKSNDSFFSSNDADGKPRTDYGLPTARMTVWFKVRKRKERFTEVRLFRATDDVRR